MSRTQKDRRRAKFHASRTPNLRFAFHRLVAPKKKNKRQQRSRGRIMVTGGDERCRVLSNLVFQSFRFPNGSGTHRSKHTRYILRQSEVLRDGRTIQSVLYNLFEIWNLLFWSFPRIVSQARNHRCRVVRAGVVRTNVRWPFQHDESWPDIFKITLAHTTHTDESTLDYIMV